MIYSAMLAYFGGMLIYLGACYANNHTTNRDAIAAWWWPFSLWDKLPDALQFDGDGMGPHLL